MIRLGFIRVSLFSITTFYLWVCVCVDTSEVREGACVRVRALACLCVQVCLQVSVYMCVCAWSRLQIHYFLFCILFSVPLSVFVPVFILSSLFKDRIISPPFTVVFATIFSFYMNHLLFLFWASIIQRKCCIPDFDSWSVHLRSAALHWVSFYYLILIWEHKAFQ